MVRPSTLWHVQGLHAKGFLRVLDRPAAHSSPAQAEVGDGGKWGTGGMATKIQAARIASAAGDVGRTYPFEFRTMIQGDVQASKFLTCRRHVIFRRQNNDPQRKMP